MGRTPADAQLSTSTGGGGHPAIALGVLVTSAVLLVAGIVLTVVARPAWDVGQWFWAVDSVDALVYGVTAWVVLSRLRHPVSWVLAVTAIGGGLAAVGAQWTLVWAQHPDLPELRMLQLAQSVAWVPGTLALIVTVPWLLREERLDLPSRLAVAGGVALIGWTVLTRVTDPFAAPSGEPYSPLAIRGESWTDFVERSMSWQNGLLVAGGLVAAMALLLRRRGAEPDARRALAWLAAAVAALAVAFVPLALPDHLAGDLPLAFTPLLHLISQALYPAAILGVVLRQQLWGLDLAVRRTLSWWLLTSGLVVAYVTLVAILGRLLPGNDGFAPVLTTAAVAAGFQPVRAWVQRGVDALVHGEASRPMQVFRQVGRTLGDAASPEALLTGMLEGIVASLRLGAARITTPGPEGPEQVLARVGEVDDRAISVPLVHQRVQVGTLWAGPRPNERLDGPSLRQLEELVGPVLGATVALAVTTADLRLSRARLADARDEERRVLRRELHDGIGPALAGIGLGLQAGRNLLERDPATAGELLETLAAELDVRVEEVRDLAHGLLPPALEELGLTPALLELGERHRAAGLAVVVELDDLPALAPAVASAVYGIVSEAVRNVQRHAQAGRCRVAARVGDGLSVTVTDDGIGISADAVAGVGTRSMRERAEGIGGTVAVRPLATGGTEVAVHVPAAILHSGPG